jgi:NhaP-type Na+/H+ or K+/H+ antiporter
LPHSTLIQLAAILVLGVMSQWVAWKVRLPSILLLLATGVFAGPITGWLKPDELFGQLLLPIVSLSVAVILYEGGLNLKLQELRSVGRVFVLLLTVGACISWASSAIAAHYILGFTWSVAALLGAILVVTGPTVIGPILRYLRLRGKVGALLKWEGIIIDPIGATLAVLVFTVIRAEAIHEGFTQAAFSLTATIAIGMIAGTIAAGVLTLALSRYWIPDSLTNPISLMLMFAAFALSNAMQAESGLLTVTVMGVLLANQKQVSIRHVVEFKETLTVLLISCLFITLAARLELSQLRGLGWESFAFVLFMVIVARPLSVLASTWGSPLSWQEKFFLCCMAPRGIVAASIASVFALSLDAAGFPRALEIAPVTFLLVFVTVLLYGLTAAPLARWLGLIQLNPQGILFVGADSWVRAVARVLLDEGVPVFLIDTDRENITLTRMAGLPCLFGSALAEATREKIDYSGLGKLFALTPNNEVNSLACMQYADDFGRQELYQLPFPPSKEGIMEVVPAENRGRLLFNKELNFNQIDDMIASQPKVKKTKLTKEFDFSHYRSEYGASAFPLLIIKPGRSIEVCTINSAYLPLPGDTVVSLVRGSIAPQAEW